MSKKTDFLGMILEMLSLGELSPKEKFVKVGNMYMKYNRGGLKYDAFINWFELLEKEIGELPTISIIENLSDEKQEKYYDYLLTEYLQMSINSFAQIISFITSKAPKQKKETDSESMIRDLSEILTNEQIISSYIKEWEFNYNLFVKPIYERMDELGHLPEKKEKYRHWQIEQVSNFFKSKEPISPLTFLLDPLDTTMRNAFVHLDYFIDNENRFITIINRKKKRNNCTEFSLDDFIKKVLRLKVNRLLFLVLISKKLSNKIGMDWKN